MAPLRSACYTTLAPPYRPSIIRYGRVRKSTKSQDSPQKLTSHPTNLPSQFVQNMSNIERAKPKHSTAKSEPAFYPSPVLLQF